jgi:hypothetical protein
MKNQPPDVFLTGAADAIEQATRVEAAMLQAGLAVFSALRLPPSGEIWDQLREELAASLSVVVLLGDRPGLSPNLAIEVGAALAWKKPTYAIVNESALRDSGALPSDMRVFSRKQVDRVISEILHLSQPLTPEQHRVLAEAYSQVNVSTDQLPRSPAALSKVTDRFNRETGSRWSGERVLREVLVMRKSGRLPKLRKQAQIRRSELTP